MIIITYKTEICSELVKSKTDWYDSHTRTEKGSGGLTDIRTMVGDVMFDVRACGILRNGTSVLVSTESDGTRTLTGGATKTRETTEAAVIREYAEETGLQVTVKRLAGVVESYFMLGELPYQQLIFIYEMSADTDLAELVPNKERTTVRWESIQHMTELKPAILNDFVQHEVNHLRHVMVHEEKEIKKDRPV